MSFFIKLDYQLYNTIITNDLTCVNDLFSEIPAYICTQFSIFLTLSSEDKYYTILQSFIYLVFYILYGHRSNFFNKL